MPEKKNTPNEINTGITEEDKVRLPPLLGLRPGVYLAVLYGLTLLVILFFVTLYPGLSNSGTVLSVNTEPAGAAVRVDGVYKSAAPCEIFVPKGKHEVEIVLPGFTGWNQEIELGGAVFCSVFFPKKVSLNVELNSPNPLDAFTGEAAEFAAWSFYGEATQANQIPLTLSTGAYRLGSAAKDPLIREGMDRILRAASRFAVTRSSLRDLVRAKFLLDNQGLSPSPLTLMESLEKAVKFLDENPKTALWLGGTLSEEGISLVTASQWYKNSIAAGNRENTSAVAGQTEPRGGLLFKEIKFTLETGSAEKTFHIAETPVSRESWELFLQERPEWRVENRESLMEKEQVNSQYLAFAEFSGLPPDITAWVSWHAAKAWCQWFNSRLPLSLEVRLPTEAEWEAAAHTGLNRAGEFWEWCEEPFVPLNFIPAPSPAYDPGSPERPVRGGSWINHEDSVDLETRGSLPPDSCSPFVSFRPVIVERGQ